MTITIADGRGALWQWDTGRRVRITDGDGVKQVHYQNKCFGRSVDVDVENDGTAIIPDELLQDWHPLTAYAYVTDDTGAYTMVQQDFVVHKRAKPAGYVYTPTDQMTLQTIQRQIGDLDDLTTEAHDTLVAAINEVAASGGSESMGLRVADGYVQYSTDGGMTWANLIAMADLKGDPGAAGQDGHSPVVTATKSGKTTTISVDGAAIATVEDGADGAPGSRGADGITPHIGDNGNWFLGENDTGKPSRGATGAPGKDGENGDPGTPGAAGPAGPAGPAGVPGKDGKDGANGITPTIGTNGNWYVGNTDTGKPSRGETGPQGAPGKNGADGKPGATGADGVTPHIGGNGNWYIGSTDTGKPSRGATGAKGDAGATGPAGPAGPAGAPGKDGANGETGPQGPKGDPGTPGAAGHTPVKGADYWTAADKQEIVNDVLAALPDGTEVAY